MNHSLDAAEQADIANAVRRHLSLVERLDTVANYYFTGLAADMLSRGDPDLLATLRSARARGRLTLNHHGANRPPSPMLIDRVKGQDWETDVATARDYERCALDAATGQLDCARVGGLKAMSDTTLGAPLWSTGRFFQASILLAAKSYGLTLGVGLRENTGAPRDDAWFLGVLNRPDRVTITPEVVARWAAGGASPLADLDALVAALDPSRIRMVSLLAHDGDFFKGKTSDQQEAYWKRYEDVIGWAASKGHRAVRLDQLFGMAADDRRRTVTQTQARAIAKTYVAAVDAASPAVPPLVVEVDGDTFALADAWEALARMLEAHQRSGSLPDAVDTSDLLGPTQNVPARSAPVEASGSDVARSASGALAAASDRVPAQTRVGGTDVNASEHLYLLAKALMTVDEGQGAVRTPGVDLLAREVAAIGASPASPGRADALTKLQFWTYKPARWVRGP
ncbi:MAG: hypothetical protein ACYC8T_08015 [Myxococcaceae bacterium]